MSFIPDSNQRHPPQLCPALQEGGHFYIQMDFCEGGTLGQRAHKVRDASYFMAN